MMTAVQSPLVDSLSRRTLLTGTTAAGLGLLAGCTTTGEQRPGASGNGFPRTVEHTSGRTEITSAPQRVVSATDYDDLDAVLAVGIAPVAFGFSPWLVPELTPWAGGAAGSTRIDGPVAEINLEKVAAQRPDLIVAQADLLADKFDLLNRIAPTITVAVRDGDWRAGTTIVGRATGREAKAATAIDRAETALDQARAELTRLQGAQVAVINRFGAAVRVDTLTDGKRGSAALITELGLDPADAATTVDGGVLADEELSRLDNVDILLLQDFGAAETDALIASPLFQQLPAVRERRTARLSRATTRAMYLLSSLSIQYACTRITTALLAAHERRASTAPAPGFP